MSSENASAVQNQDISVIVDEYVRLFSLRELSVTDQKRMAEILELATQNEELDFWISQKACEEGDKFGLKDKESRQSYDDQRALMAELIDTQNPKESMFSNPALGLPGRQRGHLANRL